MALSDKDILITPNKGQTLEPKIEFKGASSTLGPQTISLNVYPTNNGTISFEGSAGQLFSITNDLSGTLYSVNDVSGIPSIEVLDTGLVKLAQYSGNVLIGTGTDNGAKLQVNGNIETLGNGYATFGPNTGWGAYLRIGGNGNSSTSLISSISTTNGNLHIDSATGSVTYLNFYAGTGGTAFGNGNSGTVAWMGPDGDLWKGSSDNTGIQYVQNTGTWNISITGNAGTVTNGVYTSRTISTTSPLTGGGDLSANRTLALASGYGDTQNPYTSKTANTFLAAPNGASGVPTFRAIVAADIPTLNQNTTGNAGTVTNGVYTVGDQTIGGNKTFSSPIVASAGIYGAGAGATDVLIWGVSSSNPTWGIFYNEGTPDLIEFKAAGVVTSSISLDDGTHNASKFNASSAGLSSSFGGTLVTPNAAITTQTSYIQILAGSGTSTNSAGLIFHNPNISTSALEYVNTDINTGYFNFKSDDITWNLRVNNNTVWHSGNDGTGSGLDADFLKGMSVASSNTVSTVVSRDASGNFSAGTITATLSGNATNVTGTVAIANGGTGATTAATARTSLGATTAGNNLFTLANPSAVTFLRVNADNTVSTLDAATFRTAIGAGTSSTAGTVTSVSGTGTVSGLSLSGTVTSTGNLTLSGTLAVTASNFSSQTANTFLAAPNGASGVPTFRAIVAADIPTLNQNTTGTSFSSGYVTGQGTITYGSGRLQWTDLSGAGGTGLSGSTPTNPSNDWYHHIILNHANGNGYYFDIAGCFHTDTLAFRRLVSGSLTPWRYTLHDGNFNSYAPTLTGTGASGTWNIGISGNASTATTAGNVTGTVAVANGGTGASTLTGLIKGNGTSPMTAAVAGTDYVTPSASSNFTALQTFSKPIIQTLTTVNRSGSTYTVDCALGNFFMINHEFVPYATISMIGTPTTVNLGSATTGSLTLPSGLQLGDVVFVGIGSDGATPADVAGWTTISTNTAGDTQYGKLYAKRMTASPDTTFAISGVATASVGIAVAYRNTNDLSLYEAFTYAEAATSGSPNATVVTTTTAPHVVQAWGWVDDDNIAATAAPSGYSNLTTIISSTAGYNMMFANKAISGATSEDPGLFTTTATDGWAAVALAIKAYKPAPYTITLNTPPASEYSCLIDVTLADALNITNTVLWASPIPSVVGKRYLISFTTTNSGSTWIANASLGV